MSQLNRDAVRLACGTMAYVRGELYYRQGRVLRMATVNGSGKGYELIGEVDGRRVYEQQVSLRPGPRATRIDGYCSCPVGYNCKHIVALCLAHIDQAAWQPESWLEALARAGAATAVPAEDRAFFVAWILRPPPSGSGALPVEVRITRPRTNGRGYIQGHPVAADGLPYDWRLRNASTAMDRAALALLQSEPRAWNAGLELKGASGAQVLEQLADSGRLFWQSLDRPLAAGPPRALRLEWQQDARDHYRLQTIIEPQAWLILTEPLWYVDETTAALGPLEGAEQITAEQWPLLLQAPSCPPDTARELSRRLTLDYPDLPLPPPLPLRRDTLSGLAPTPVLELVGVEFDQGDGRSRLVHALELGFRYGEHAIEALPPTPRITLETADDALLDIERDAAAEQAAAGELERCGFTRLEAASGPIPFLAQADNLSLSGALWQRFLDEEIPRLRATGWDIVIDDSFALRFESAELDEELEGGDDWFALRYDLELDGEKWPLAPLIAPLIDQLLDLPDEDWPERVPLHVGDGRFLSVPAERLRPALKLLRELYDPDELAAERLRRSRFDAAPLAALDAERAAAGQRRLIELAQKLRDFSGITPAPPPAGLTATLRPYQQQGLDWLQFLREYGFNGILADDMGLGKTLQTLAHLLLEKEQGRLEAPALVIAPTSLMSNWRREAERFTPALKVLVLQGNDRRRHFDAIPAADLVLSTYPLLARDAEALGATRYHSVILDEAQHVKNPKTRAARVVRELDTAHRLCLTGTPMENHLGELWALFDFLMPGFLWDARQFKQSLRTPIETERDPEARAALTRRIRPFMLRRTKDAVASELPPKTEIQHLARFDTTQANLYESIRVAMDRRVREAIAAQGLARSHITILDALLKLRQTCCDPRLLKLEQARKVTRSAKLELLLEMLPEMLEEGRRVLLFSQFTQMLGLIEPELDARGIRYSKLTGQTRRRDEAIQRFRGGDADLFLISLKAGGTGLNLPEADTVILYDPWWNPAVEAQAADRAHRIGQDKPVFVYRLLVENSVEETIHRMQQRKRALADALYRGKAGSDEALFDAEALRALFAPVG